MIQWTKTVKSTRARVTCGKLMKNYKSLYFYIPWYWKCQWWGKCGMELIMASPSREITAVAHGVLKEGHAIGSKGLWDFWETVPGMLLSPSRNRALHCGIWRYQASKKPVSLSWTYPAETPCKMEIHPSRTRRHEYITWISNSETQCHPTGFYQPFSMLVYMVTCAEGGFCMISWKRRKSLELGLHTGWLRLWVKIKHRWQLHYQGWPWKIVKREKLSNRAVHCASNHLLCVEGE